jgi:uncharacterized protein with PIN domain
MTSKNEDEYFAKLDAELMAKQRASQMAEAEAAERRSHLMRCPKCGGRLVHADREGVQIESCPDCHGIWLDQGEFETLARQHPQGLLARIFSDFRTTIENRPEAK